MPKWHQNLLLTVLLLLPSWAQALQLTDTRVPINGAWQVLVSSQNATDVEQLLPLTDSDWTPIDNAAGNIGMTNTTHWLRLNITNPDQLNEWYLVFNNRGINRIDGWWLDDNTVTSAFSIGATIPYNEGRHLPVNRLNTPVPVSAGQSRTLLVRIDHVGYLDVNGALYPASDAIVEFRRNASTEWLFYGIYIAFLMLHLGLYASSRERSHLGYVAFVGSAFLFFLYTEGYTYRIFQYSPSMAYLVGQSSIALVSISSAFFTLTFLSLRHSRARWLMRGIIAVGSLLILGRIVSKAFPILPLGALLAILTFIAIPLVSLHQQRINKLPFALSFFVAWSMWSLLTATVTLASFGIFQADVSVLWIYLKIAFVAHNLVLTWSVGLQMRELSVSRNRARAESEAKSDLIAQVSHEIRTPMNGIIGTSQLLEPHLKDEEAHHLNEVIFHSGTTLLTIINDLLDLSRLETGRIQLRPEPVDLRRMLNQVFTILSSQIQQKQLNHELFVSDEVPDRLELDPVRLRQVLLNLVGNAIKYTDSGRVRVLAEYRHNNLTLLVEDTGRGIPEAKIPELFEPYVQVREDAEEERKGTGLGLHIAKSLVSLMKGRLDLESEENQGTRVQIRIPCQAIRTEVPQPDEQRLTEKSTLSILIADDNQVNRTVLSGLLRRMGHQVKETSDGTHAVSEYLEHFEKYDAILMDCEMPQMDGFTATRKIREIEIAKHLPPIPILAVTAHAFDSYREQVFTSGMDGHLSKPITRDALALALQEL